MKNFIFSSILIIAISVAAAAQQKVQTIKVAGTCGMCKKRIEEAALKNGVSKAEWNKKNQTLQIRFDPNTVRVDQVQKSIAEAGHDNEGFKATDEAYNQLHECCKYDRSSESDSTFKSCSESKKCKGKKKCCRQGDETKCQGDMVRSACMKEKEANKKGCCKEH